MATPNISRRRQLQPEIQPEMDLSFDDITIVDKSLLKRAVGAMAIGNAMEWFDFGVYSYIAVTLGKVFFPSSNPGAQLIATFGTFAAAFLVRPLGGMVFGPLGDRLGRKRVLAVTMIMMAVGTFCIGLIPNYGRIGIFAPILLLVARLVQGFSTGGEYGGAATFIAEFATDKKRGFMGSFLEFGTLGLIGLYIRLKLEETPAFQYQADKRENDAGSMPKVQFHDILIKHWRAMLQCVGLVLIFNVTDYMALSYLPSYLSATLKFNETYGLFVVLIVMVLMMPMTLGAGYLSDKIGRKPVMMFGCVGLLVLSMPALTLIRMGTALPIFGGMLILGVLLSSFTGAMPSALPALFPTKIRYSALAIGFNVSVSLFGGTTPLVTAWLVSSTGNLMMPAYYLMGASVIGIISVLALHETARQPLEGSPPSVGSQSEAHAVLRSVRAC